MAQKTTKTKSLDRCQNCLVLEIGIEKYGECLMEESATCSDAVPFRYGYLCKNPYVEEMIENTKKIQARAGVFI